MSTTSIIVEHLLAGVLALLAGALGLAACLGYHWVDWGFVEDHQVFVGVVAVALAYPLGIAVDEISDWIGRRWRVWLGSPDQEGRGESPALFAIMIRHDNETLRNYFDYLRGRQRMLRSAALTSCVATVNGAWLIVRQVPGWKWEWLAVELAAGSALFGTCLWAAHATGQTFRKRRRQAADILEGQSGGPRVS